MARAARKKPSKKALTKKTARQNQAKYAALTFPIDRRTKNLKQFAKSNPGQHTRQKAAMSETIESRMSRHGLTPDQAKDQRAGYVLGVLCIKGHICEGLHDAGVRWLRVVMRFARLKGIPMATCKAASLMRLGGRLVLDDVSPEESSAITREYNDAFIALGASGRNSVMSVNECVVRDEIPLLISLRPGLFALADHFGIATTLKR